MATMDDIARALGVSKGTVSKALSGAEDISETMRKNVLEKAVELGYTRIIRSHAHKKICVFVLHMAYENPEDFGWDIVTGFRKMAEPSGYAVDVIKLDEQTQNEIPYEEYMLRGDYHGALILGMSLADPWMHCFKTSRTPAVLYDNHISGNPAITQIGVDNSEGMRTAVAHLFSLGHRRIGYMSSELKAFVYQQRYRAFFDAMREYGLEADPSIAVSTHYTSDCIKLYLPELIKKGCTAIICSHDLLAHGAMIHCQELGIRIPQDLSIVGFDDIPLCRYTLPPLTTIRQNRGELGKSAFFALSSQMNGVPISALLLHAELIIRASTAGI